MFPFLLDQKEGHGPCVLYHGTCVRRIQYLPYKILLYGCRRYSISDCVSFFSLPLQNAIVIYYFLILKLFDFIRITDKVPLKKVIEKDFQKATRTYKQTLKDVARSLARIFKKTYKELEFQNVRLKYADPTCGCISELPEIQPAAWKEYVTFRKAEPPKKKAKRN